MREGNHPGDNLRALCWTSGGDNASGYTVAQARKEARRQGWKLGPGNRAVCPGCKAPTP